MATTDPWPPFADQQLVRRLGSTPEQLVQQLPAFLERITGLMDAIAAGTPEERIAMAHGYPWERVERPVRLRDGEVLPDGPLRGDGPRWPVVAIGANGSPTRLALKLDGVDVADARMVPATLEGHDVVACPFPTGYGSFAGTIAVSPGTRVRVTVLELTAPQVERLTLTEFGYAFGRLAGTVARGADGVLHRDPLAYVHHGGAYGIDDEPVALAAIPATGRRLRAMTQAELLEDCAGRLRWLEADLDGARLLRRILDDPIAFVQEHHAPLLADAVPTPQPGFVPYPTP